MLKTIIIDDEESNIQVLSILIEENFSNLKIVATAQNIQKGEEIIRLHKPDILFLDIQMPYGSGFDLLKNLKQSSMSVIFVTAYDQYAIKAFKISAVDYLLKPVALEDLQEAIDKCIKMRDFHLSNPIQYEDLLKNTTAKLNKRILVLNKYSDEKIQYQNIVYIEGDSNYSIIHTLENQKIMIAKTLKEFEELLCDETYYFLRLHKSYIINTQYIKSIQKKEPASLTLINNQTVEIPQRRRLEILDILTSLNYQ
ncbi:MAG: LytTR family DNA-binding domain-containing protein [Raineya sp.]|jgi:two-component system LytT family response regulator|nr:LytTR family DNA-binding domain-containing protein [Raineya sp.]